MYFRTYCFSLNQVVVVIYLKKVGVCVCVCVCSSGIGGHTVWPPGVNFSMEDYIYTGKVNAYV